MSSAELSRSERTHVFVYTKTRPFGCFAQIGTFENDVGAFPPQLERDALQVGFRGGNGDATPGKGGACERDL